MLAWCVAIMIVLSPATMLKLKDGLRIKWVGDCVCGEVKGEGRKEAGGDRRKFSECPNLLVLRIVVCAGQK